MDTIANMLTIIRNGQMVGKETVKVPYSNFKFELAKFIEKLGYLAGVEKSGKKEKKYLELTLKYASNKEPAILILERVSKPGKKIYSDSSGLRWASGGHLIVSTSKGLMTGKEAKKANLGGELICFIA